MLNYASDLSTAGYDLEFPVIKTQMGPKHRAASPLIIIIKLNQRGTDTMGLGNVFPTATVLSDVGLLSHIFRFSFIFLAISARHSQAAQLIDDLPHSEVWLPMAPTLCL